MPPKKNTGTSSTAAVSMTQSGPSAPNPTVARLCAITEAARLLHDHRPGWTRLLCEHVPDSADRCTICRGPGGFAPAWPCSLYLIGRAAQQLAEPDV